MLSQDEIAHGMTFILKLWDVEGKPTQWVETLRGDIARRWYNIYATSNWEALRLEAADTFHHDVSEAEAEATRTTRGRRCIYIHTPSVKPDQLAVGRGGA